MGSSDDSATGAGPTRKHNEKIKRTRTGCLTCRRRKKKCGEEKPVCKSCNRNNLECIWPDPSAPARRRRKRLSNVVVVYGTPGMKSEREENTIDNDSDLAIETSIETSIGSSSASEISSVPSLNDLNSVTGLPTPAESTPSNLINDSEIDDILSMDRNEFFEKDLNNRNQEDIMEEIFTADFGQESDSGLSHPSMTLFKNPHPITPYYLPDNQMSNFNHFIQFVIPALTLPYCPPRYSLVLTLLPFALNHYATLETLIAMSLGHQSNRTPELELKALTHYNRSIKTIREEIIGGSVTGNEAWLFGSICSLYLFEIWNGDDGSRSWGHLNFVANVVNQRYKNGFPRADSSPADTIWIESYCYHTVFCAVCPDLAMPLTADRAHVFGLEKHPIVFKFLDAKNLKKMYGKKPWTCSPIFGIYHDLFRIIVQAILLTKNLPLTGVSAVGAMELLLQAQKWAPPADSTQIIKDVFSRPTSGAATPTPKFDDDSPDPFPSPFPLDFLNLDSSGANQDHFSGSASASASSSIESLLAPAETGNAPSTASNDSPDPSSPGSHFSPFTCPYPSSPFSDFLNSNHLNFTTVDDVAYLPDISPSSEPPIEDPKVKEPPLTAAHVIIATVYQQFTIVTIFKYISYPSLDYVFSPVVQQAVQTALRVCESLPPIDMAWTPLDWPLLCLGSTVTDPRTRLVILSYIRNSFLSSSKKWAMHALSLLKKNWKYLDNYLKEAEKTKT